VRLAEPTQRSPGRRTIRLAALAMVLLLGACAAPKPPPRPDLPPQHAIAPRPDDAFAPIEAAIRTAHGADASGFVLLDSNDDGLRWRLALIDSARHSIDVQVYVWYGDLSGRLLLKRVLDAADRGVKVRLLVDDLNTLLKDAATPQIRDEVFAAIDAHPNLQVRLFNPWVQRDLLGRGSEMVSDLERLNHRMHNKQLIVDNRAAIIGGRNIGDEYLGLNPEFNFRDLDVLGIGPVARQGSAVFDRYWNSAWVWPASLLPTPPPKDRRAARAVLEASLAARPALQYFAPAPQAWTAELAALPARLHPGTSRVVSDEPVDGTIRHTMMDHTFEVAGTARREVLVENAYVIPNQAAIDWVRALTDRGVRIGLVTNSLASHDVPAVNSHYKKWRKTLLEAGVALHEIRHDAAVQLELADTPPTRATFMGLHAKAVTVDGRRAVIGSMNMDPRSGRINTEMAVIVDSPGLAEAVAALIRRDMEPVNSWRVVLGGQGELRWISSERSVDTQPARSVWQRVLDVVFMAFPAELY
jgi:putative cardiolipin synthase